MYEVELKVPASLDQVRERLQATDAEKTGHRRQRDVYYDAPHRDFAATDEALRVRYESDLDDESARDTTGGDTSRLTYKGPRLDAESKTRTEHETAVRDPDEIDAILARLGFEPAATVEKRREYWAFEQFTVTLDAVTDVGEFVEIEREVTDEAAIDATRESAIEVLSRLDIDAANQVQTSYLGLLLTDE